MKYFLLLYFFLLLISCKKEPTFNDELTSYLNKKIDKQIKKENEKIEDFRLISIDSLNEYEIASYVANINIEILKSLNKEQNLIGKQINSNLTKSQILEIQKKLKKISDSVASINLITNKIYDSKPDSTKTEYFKYKFLLHTKKINSTITKDTIYFYSTTSNKKEIIPEINLVDHIISKKYKK